MTDDERKEAVRQHRMIEALSEICQVIHRHAKVLNTEHFAKTGANYLTRSIVDARRLRQSRPPIVRLRMDEEARIKEGVKEKALPANSRNYLTVHVGGKPFAEKGEKPKYGNATITIRVGWAWRRTVYDPLYKNGNLDSQSWFLLSAQEVKVNDRMIRLYRGLAYSRANNETREVYVGQARLGGQKAAVRATASAAAEAARALIAQEIDTKLTQENSDDEAGR